MIISHKHRFIFVKTRKTAGTSIEVFLSKHCGQSDIVTPIIPRVEGHVPRNHKGFFNHIPAHAIRQRIDSSVWNEYFKFCVERNPWDKTLSHFFRKRGLRDPTLTLDAYLASGKLPLNYMSYTEPTNPAHIIVDKVLYYEDLTNGLRCVFSRLGIPFDGSLGVNAKSGYRTDRRPYHEIFTPKQAAIVAEAFRVELALHGYGFRR